MNTSIIANNNIVLIRRVILGLAWTLAIVSLYFIFIRISDGMTKTHLGNTVAWGLWVSLYIYFIGLSAGSFLLSSLVYVFGFEKFEKIGRLALWQALVCLGLGIIFIWFDLGRMERILNPILHFQPTSVLAWEIMFYGLYIVLLVSELYLLSKKATPEERKKIMRIVKVLAIIGFPVALGVHGGTGAIFAVVKARPYWYSAVFPIVFIVSAIVSGGALLLFVRVVMDKTSSSLKNLVEEYDMLKSLSLLVIGILAFDMLMLGLEFLVGMYGGIPDHTAALWTMMTGPFWWVFWFIQLGLGVVIPTFIITNGRLNKSITWLGMAGLFIFIGIFGVRLNIVIPPFATPEFGSLPDVYHHFRMTTDYFPSIMEIMSSLGIVSMGTLVFFYGLSFLKLNK